MIAKHDVDRLYELQKEICKKILKPGSDYYAALLEQDRIAAGANLSREELHSMKVLLNYCTVRGLPPDTAYRLLAAAGFQIFEPIKFEPANQVFVREGIA